MKRALILLEQMRAAEAAGHGWEWTTVGGRAAVRIRREDGAQTSLLTDEERRELEAALSSGPPALDVAGLPRCTWSGARHAFVGEEDGIEIVVLAAPTIPRDDALPLASVLSIVRGRLDRIREEVAERLAGTAAQWGSPSRLARIRVVSITLATESDEAHVWMSDGGAFGGHSIEVWLDREARVRDAQLAG